MAGTALAVCVGGAHGALAQTVINGGDAVIAVDPGASPAIIFQTDHIATVNNAVNITDTVTTTAAGQGTLTFLGASTMTGVVGDTGAALKVVNAGAGNVTFTNNVLANDINFTGANTLDFGGNVIGDINLANFDGTIQMADGGNITGAITSTAGGNNGTLTMLGATNVSGDVGDAGNTLKAINGGASGSSTISGAAYATDLNITGTGKLTMGSTFDGTDITYAAAGTLDLQGATTLGGQVDFAGNNGTLIVGSGEDFAADIDNSGGANNGNVTLGGGTQAISGDLGSSNALNTVNVGATGGDATFSGTVDTQNIKFTGAGKATFNNTVTGAVDFSDNDGEIVLGNNIGLTGSVDNTGAVADLGTLTLSGGGQTVTAAVGATNALKVVNAGADASVSTFNSTVNAQTINVTGTGDIDFDDDVTGDLSFAGNGTAIFSNGKGLTGNVGATGANTGTLDLEGGNQTITGTVGSGNALQTVKIQTTGGSTATFNSTVNAQNINLTSTGAVDFDDDVTGAITFQGGNATITLSSDVDVTGTFATTGNNTGNITFSSDVTVSGNIGADGLALNTLDFAAGVPASNIVLSGDVFASDFILSDTGNVEFKGAIKGTTMEFQDAAIVTVNGAVTLATGVEMGGVDGTLVIASGVDFDSVIDNTGGAGKGTVTLAGGTQTVSKNVGATNSIAAINAAADGADSTFDGTVAATKINLTGTGSLTLNDNVTSTIDFNGLGGTLTFGDGADLTGSITTSNNGNGAVVIAGSSTVSSDIGGVGKLVNSLTVGATGSTSTFSGDVFATTVNISSDGTVNFGGDLTGTTLKFMDAATVNFTDVAGTVALSSGVDFNGEDGTLALPAGVGFASDIDNTGAASGKGTLTLAGGAQTVAGDIGSTLSIGTINAAAGGATSNFSGKVVASTINLTGTGTLNLADDVTGNIAYNAAGGTVNLSDGADVTGNITLALDDQGILALAGSSTITGDVGGVGKAVSTINAGAASSTSKFDGDVYATAINIVANGSVEFTGDVVSTLDGTGGVVGTGVGDVILSGSTTALESIGQTGILRSLTLDGTGNTVTVTGGNVEAADTTSLELNTLNVAAGKFTIAAGQTLNFDVGTATSGKILSAVAPSINATANIILNVSSTEYVADGTTYTIIDDLTDSGGMPAISLVASNTPMVTYAQDLTNTDDLVITVSRKALNTFATTKNSVIVADLMDGLAMGGDADLDAVQIALQTAGNAGDTAAVTSILESLTSSVDGGVINSNLNLGSITQGINDGRLASLRLGDASYYLDGETGVSAGVMTNGYGVWTQAYGLTAKQDSFNSYSGYDLDTHGLVFGMDTSEIFEDTVFGVSFAFGQTSVTAENTNQTATDINNYGFTVYSNYDFNNTIFLDTQIGYGYNVIESTRYNVGDPMAPQTARSDYSSSQFMGKMVFGADLWTDGGVIVTPTLSAAPTYLSVGSYAEQGAGGAGLRVESTDMFVLDVGVGLNLATKLKSLEGGSMIKPMVHAAYSKDLMSERYYSTASFIGDPGNTLFKTSDTPTSQDKINTGMGVVYSADLWAMSLNYDYELRDHYDAHSGALRLMSGF